MSSLELLANAATEREVLLEELETSPTTTLVVDASGIILRARNGRLLKALGYSWPDDVEGQHINIFIDFEKRDWHNEMITRFMIDPEKTEIDIQGGRLIDAITANNDGTVPVSVVVVKKYLRDGKAYGLRGPFKGAYVYVTVGTRNGKL